MVRSYRVVLEEVRKRCRSLWIELDLHLSSSCRDHVLLVCGAFRVSNAKISCALSCSVMGHAKKI